jgi:hypothetical protein
LERKRQRLVEAKAKALYLGQTLCATFVTLTSHPARHVVVQGFQTVAVGVTGHVTVGHGMVDVEIERHWITMHVLSTGQAFG